MTATIEETYQVVKAEIVQNEVDLSKLQYKNFYGMMSMIDFEFFKQEVLAGRRRIDEPFQISWR